MRDDTQAFVCPACFQLPGMLMHTLLSSKCRVNATEQYKAQRKVFYYMP